ncbi:two-component system, OmpR family, copper resistance phosphate regulon response regulator CusR [Goodfellowiella coeruleoviolacea]|uniref:Two-component system, OmpR family, copper resistance phosphate regulon response regulator CusR n=1 Tax=Goodfellowiella coeruleoviolacea TaxID=334858 RepID=A0AAE3GAA0_9PSEU|nr:two-component system, OmpR family, copper resistance phosphate regulon response regulator CusR [Goodfellowiella coeruleoviolacea]
MEDDNELAFEIVSGLRQAGFAVDLAVDAGSADLNLSTYTYDCVVLDRGLPDGEGLALLRGWRERGERVPVLVLTAMDSVDERVAGFHHGADDYVGKPFAMAELVARVGALCRRLEQPRPTTIRFDDVEIDVPRRRVFRGGVLLSLTTKEFAVLELLASRRGSVVSRSELIEHCWDEMAQPMSNVVDAVIAQLRRKLGPPPLIATVRGVGFLISETA